MKIYDLINYFKTRNGIFLLFLIVIVMVLLVLKLKFPEKTQRVHGSPGDTSSANGPNNGDINQDSQFFKINRKVAQLNGSKFFKKDASTLSEKNSSQKIPKVMIRDLNIYSRTERCGLRPASDETVIVQNAREFIDEPDVFAPIGRLLKCELVNTIDSCNVETPIVGIVTEDLYWNGHLIIPANTEVHGTALTTRLKQKVASGRSWQLILPKGSGRPNGAVLDVKGVALDREESADSIKTYGITDGSFGITGYRIMSTEPKEIQMFIASFMQGVFSGLQTPMLYNYAFTGPSIPNTMRSATLEGTAKVMGNYVEELHKEIEEKGFYTRVPAGKQFYLYVTERIEPDQAYFKKIKRKISTTEGENT